jgi:hypothetical protein
LSFMAFIVSSLEGALSPFIPPLYTYYSHESVKKRYTRRAGAV